MLIDKVDLNEIGVKDKIKTEVGRFKKFQKAITGSQEEINVDDIDIHNYTKYILRDDRDYEKRELLLCLRNKIFMKDRKIYLDKN